MNKVKCLLCKDIIESTYTHDYVECKCGNIAVDGGSDYARRIGQGIVDHSYEEIGDK